MHHKIRLQKIKSFILDNKLTLFSAFLIVLSAFIWNSEGKKGYIESHEYHNLEVYECNRMLYSNVPIVSQRKLNDDNDTQLLHAQANGLKEIYIFNQSFEEDSAMLVKQNLLVRLKNNPLYHLKDLTHSYPYTTPEMAKLLNDIGLIFREKLKEKNQDHFRFLVTSALRTNEHQGNLSKRNRNATTLSTHLYGATIDITYKEFFNIKADSIEQNYYAAVALRETMLDLREQCRLVAVREKRQACYHFTVVNCDPQKVPQDSISKQTLIMY